MILFSGCAYRMGMGEIGSTLGVPKRAIRIAITPVRNLSLAPQAEGIFNEQLQRYFIRTSGWKLVEESQADVVLEITLESFDTHLESQQDERPQSLKLSLQASAALRSTKSNAYLFQGLCIGTDTLSEVSETEDIHHAILPILTRDLAELVGRAVTHSWPLPEVQKKQNAKPPSR